MFAGYSLGGGTNLASLPYYKMYPREFDHDEKVRGMRIGDIGLYILCLNHAWSNDGLPEDPKEVSALVKVFGAEFKRSWIKVEQCFPVSSDGRRRNPRQERERCDANDKSEKSKDAANKRHYGNKPDADALHKTSGGSTATKDSARSRASDPDYAPVSSIVVETTNNQETTPRAEGISNEGIYCTPPKDTPLADESTHNKSELFPPRRKKTSASEDAAFWTSAGWDSPEHFDTWWNSFLAGYPNPAANFLARSKALESVAAGKLQRAQFEEAYAKHRERWDAGFEPNVGRFFNDEMWRFAPRPRPVPKTGGHLSIEELAKL